LKIVVSFVKKNKTMHTKSMYVLWAIMFTIAISITGCNNSKPKSADAALADSSKSIGTYTALNTTFAPSTHPDGVKYGGDFNFDLPINPANITDPIKFTTYTFDEVRYDFEYAGDIQSMNLQFVDQNYPNSITVVLGPPSRTSGNKYSGSIKLDPHKYPNRTTIITQAKQPKVTLHITLTNPSTAWQDILNINNKLVCKYKSIKEH